MHFSYVAHSVFLSWQYLLSVVVVVVDVDVVVVVVVVWMCPPHSDSGK